MPQSPFFPRSDILIDAIVLATVLAVPILVYAIAMVRQGRIVLHRRIQLSLTWIFVIATIALEVDIRMAGGMDHFSKGGAYEGTALLRWVLYVHLAIAFANAVGWIAFPVWSSIAYRRGTLPGPSSATHRWYGKVCAVLCVLTAVTGVGLYVVGFVL